MNIRERTINELLSLEIPEMMIIYDMIQSLKEKRNNYPKHKTQEGDSPFIRVRNALRNCKGSFSNDILKAREDRI